MNEYLIPASTIAVELLRAWRANNSPKEPDSGELAALYGAGFVLTAEVIDSLKQHQPVY